MKPVLFFLGAMVATCVGTAAIADEPAGQAAAEAAELEPAIARGLQWLGRETAAWSTENECFSCHHNGDAARVLYTARGRGLAVDLPALTKTSDWLTHPDRWDHNGGDEAFNDRQLANIQFAGALRAGIAAGQLDGAEALRKAAGRVARDQREDGSFAIEGTVPIGGSVTYGRFLATAMARETLAAADPQEFQPAIARIDDWLRTVRPQNVLDAAGMLQALATAGDERAAAQRTICFDLIDRGQAPSGGWGPYVESVPEPFDTAVVLLAQTRLPAADRPPGGRIDGDRINREQIERGRRFLIAGQLSDGSWPATTRPRGGVSYAQTTSTTAWAVLALIESRRQLTP